MDDIKNKARPLKCGRKSGSLQVKNSKLLVDDIKKSKVILTFKMRKKAPLHYKDTRFTTQKSFLQYITKMVTKNETVKRSVDRAKIL